MGTTIKDFDIEDIEISREDLEPPAAITFKYYKIIAEKTKTIANIFVLELIDGRQIQIYWNTEFITDETDSNLVADIRKIIPGYEHHKAGTTVAEYYCSLRTKYDLKSGMEYEQIFNCSKNE